MSRDTGIRNLIPGYRDPDEIKEDQNTRRYIETIVNRGAQVSPKVEPLGETLARITPVLNLGATGKIKEAAEGFKSQKEFEDHLIASPTKRDHAKAYNMGRSLLKVPEAEKNKMAKEWMTSGGRDPDGRSLDEEIELGKQEWLKKQKDEAVMLPVGLGNNYKSDIRSPVEKKRDSYNAKVAANKARIEANKAKADPTKGAHYIEWYDRMARDEAENLNQIKRTTWEQGGKVKPEPNYVTPQDVSNVYKNEASPLQMKNLHKRLENHNEMTGQFKNLPKEEKPTHTPRFLHNPATNELEDTYDPNWGNDIFPDTK